MKVSSKTEKPQIEIRGRKLYIRYSESQLATFDGSTITDFVPETETSESEETGDKETTLSYQQIVVPTASNRDDIISAIINDRYSKDSQIAVLANKDDGIASHADEWTAFQKFREFSKKLADKVLSE